MITRVSKNVVCIKNIPSNLIEEAFFILKSTNEEQDDKLLGRKEEIITSEINEFINECVVKFQKEKEEAKKKKTECKKRLTRIKTNAIMIIGMVTFLCIIIANILK